MKENDNNHRRARAPDRMGTGMGLIRAALLADPATGHLSGVLGYPKFFAEPTTEQGSRTDESVDPRSRWRRS
jgi:hypothetical protein